MMEKYIYIAKMKTNRYLHIIGWKSEGKWDIEETAVDVAILSTMLLAITWSGISVYFWML